MSNRNLLLMTVLMGSVAAAQQQAPAADPVQVARAALAAAVAKDGAGSVGAAKAQLEFGKALIRVGQAEPAAREAAAALVVFEAHLPAEELSAADALLVLGASHGSRGLLPEAADFYRRSLGIRERLDPPAGPYVQLLRLNLAATLQSLFDFRGALELAEAGLRHADQTPGAESAGAGTFCAVIALCLDGLGNYREAYDLYLRAERILRRTRGQQYPDALRMAGMAGVTACRLGQPEEGLPRMAAALAEMRASPQVPLTVFCELEAADAILRTIYQPEGDPAAALRTAMARLEDPTLPDDFRASRRLMLMTMLADLDPDAMDLDVARLALAQCEQSMGADHEQFASLLGNVARMTMAHGRLEDASPYLKRALAIFDQRPWYVSTDRWKIIWGATQVARIAGRNDDVLALVHRGIAEMPRLLTAWSSPLDEVQRLEVIAAARAAVDLGLSIGAHVDQPAAERWQLVLAWKGLVSRGVLESLQWLQQNRNVETQRLTEELQVIKARWSATVRSGADEPVLAAARQRREAVEQDLTARFAAATGSAPTAAAVTAALAADEVLVDFVTYGKVKDLTARDVQLEERLLAFVARRGASVVAVDLGPLEPITAAVTRFLQVGSRWTRPIAGADALVAAAGGELAKLVWAPLQPHVPDAARVVLCPESVISVVPFACLPGRAAGSFLLEEHEFTYVASPGDVLQRREFTARVAAASLLVVGDVDYGERRAAATEREGFRDFAPLPGSGAEIDAIASLFVAAHPESTSAPVVLRGAAASADGVGGGVAGKAFVHIATHGWFRGSRSLPDVGQRWLYLEARGKALPADAMAPGAAGGIALAGANGAQPGVGDGVLTVDELKRLDLSQCELAVLSACETGLGTISAGDGLLGLRRSLRLAGARRSLTSIWRVDDQATLRCMQSFYKGLWSSGRQPAAALREAQLAMLRAARADSGQALVGTWGAFVLEVR